MRHRIRLGLRVVARVAAYPDEEFTGAISAINAASAWIPAPSTSKSNFRIRTVKLQPGMFATATVLLSGTEKAVFVSRDAILGAIPVWNRHRYSSSTVGSPTALSFN